MNVTPIVGMSLSNSKLAGTITVVDPEKGTFTITLTGNGQQVEVAYRNAQGAVVVPTEPIEVSE